MRSFFQAILLGAAVEAASLSNPALDYHVQSGYVTAPAGRVDPKNVSHQMVEYVGQQPVYHGLTHYTGNYHHDPAHGNYGLEPHHDDYHDFKPDDHYHHDEDPNIIWQEPSDFEVPEVEYTPRRYEEYIPRFEKNVVPFHYEYEEAIAEPVFTPYNLFADGEYGSQKKPFYDPYLDPLHKPKDESESTDSELGTSDSIHTDSNEIGSKSSTESEDGNYVPVLNPNLHYHNGSGFAHGEEVYLEDPHYQHCDCADIAAERDALLAELTLLKIRYEGYDPLYEEDLAPQILPRHGLGDVIVADFTVGDGTEYLYPGLDRASSYYDPALSPLNDPYYHDPAEFYSSQVYENGSLHTGDPLGFFDFVTDPSRLNPYH